MPSVRSKAKKELTDIKKEEKKSLAVLGPSPPIQRSKTYLDSGSNGHYIATSTALINKKQTDTPLLVEVANQGIMSSTTTGELPLHNLPKEARTAHKFTNLGDKSLISLRKLCDA